MYHVNAGDLPGNEVSRTFEGGRHGPCSVSFFLVHNQPGHGPRLHHHPYDETFVILEGHVRVSVGACACRVTSFVGRAGAVDEVAGLLGEYRLVTVTGPGGGGEDPAGW